MRGFYVLWVGGLYPEATACSVTAFADKETWGVFAYHGFASQRGLAAVAIGKIVIIWSIPPRSYNIKPNGSVLSQRDTAFPLGSCFV
jgi:hypothetical protein